MLRSLVLSAAMPLYISFCLLKNAVVSLAPTRVLLLKTLINLKNNGLRLCSGGLIGLGETPVQWLEMVFILRDLGVDCIPINILNPRPGTPLENMVPLPPQEILKLIAIMRLIVPDTHIRLAGGREVNLRDLQATAFLAGVTGMIVGGYLTTGGRHPDDDYQMLEDLEVCWEGKNREEQIKR